MWADGSPPALLGQGVACALLELGLWRQAGVEPTGAWDIESGQSTGQTLGIANGRRACTITDRGTWLAFQKMRLSTCAGEAWRGER